MAQYEDQNISFGLLALVRDPLPELQQRLTQSECTVTIIEAELKKRKTDCEITEQDATTATANVDDAGNSASLSQSDHAAEPKEDVTAQFLTSDESFSVMNFSQLKESHQRKLKERSSLLAELRREISSQKVDEVRAANRRWDYGPFIRRWLQIAIRNGTLKTTLEK